jgi:hypothetical protein
MTAVRLTPFGTPAQAAESTQSSAPESPSSAAAALPRAVLEVLPRSPVADRYETPCASAVVKLARFEAREPEAPSQEFSAPLRQILQDCGRLLEELEVR